MSTLNLSGKNNKNSLNLLGKVTTIHTIPFQIKELKIKIINHLILPIIGKQWKHIYENRFYLEKLKKKTNYYIECYKLEDLSIYLHLLQLIDLLISEHIQLEEIEKKLYGRDVDSHELTSMIYKTTMIRLKPEYEIYDSIFGKPLSIKNESYNLDIIKDILIFMTVENIHFTKIKSMILDKYDVKK